MKVILLGTGGPKPDPNLAVQVDSTILLFDAGRGAATQLARTGISVGDVDRYLSRIIILTDVYPYARCPAPLPCESRCRSSWYLNLRLIRSNN